MIHRTLPTWQILDWQEELKHLIVCPETLLKRLELGNEWLPAARKASALFPLRVTESYLSRIEKSKPNDPLLLQVLPLQEELSSPVSFTHDPLQENQFSPCKGVIHKYASRVLVITSTQCAINCRYCFRRHFPYSDNQMSRTDWQYALDYVSKDPNINEIILSGGDPLSISDKQLAWITEQVGSIEHIKRLRIHTRYPIILPNRITASLIQSLSHTKLKTIMVIHCNHPQEIDDTVQISIKKLEKSGFLLLNQSVLLKNINDNSKILATLSERLFDCGVSPYYLHILDQVDGASHFSVDDEHAKLIYRDLLAKVPGYLAPKLVREIPHEASKTPIGLG